MKNYKINYTENCIDVEYKGKSMCWTMSELQEDTEAILSVINAVKLACEGKLDKLTGAWRKGNPHEDTRFCTKCGKTSDLIDTEHMCYSCAKERGRV